MMLTNAWSRILGKASHAFWRCPPFDQPRKGRVQVKPFFVFNMKKLSYSEQLKHPSWQKRRLEVLSEADFTCQGCYDKETTLHVHHKQYFSGRMAWEYSNDELIVLCEDCHDDAHKSIDEIRRIFSLLPADGPNGLSQIHGVISGYLDGYMGFKLDEQMRENTYSYSIGYVARSIGSFSTAEQMLEIAARLYDFPRDKQKLLISDFIKSLKDSENA